MIDEKNLLMVCYNRELDHDKLTELYDEISAGLPVISLSSKESDYTKIYNWNLEVTHYVLLNMLHALGADIGRYNNHFSMMDFREPINFHYNVWHPFCLGRFDLSYQLQQMYQGVVKTRGYRRDNRREMSLEDHVDYYYHPYLEGMAGPLFGDEDAPNTNYFSNSDNWTPGYINHYLHRQGKHVTWGVPHGLYFVLVYEIDWNEDECVLNCLKELDLDTNIVSPSQIDLSGLTDYVLLEQYRNDRTEKRHLLRRNLFVLLLFFYAYRDIDKLATVVQLLFTQNGDGENLAELDYLDIRGLVDNFNERHNKSDYFSFEELYSQIYLNTRNFVQLVKCFDIIVFGEMFLNIIFQYDETKCTSNVMLSNGNNIVVDWRN